MRRLTIGFLALVLGLAATMGTSSGGNLGAVSITIRKVVTGPAPSGFTIVVNCEVEAPPSTITATLNFDATGAPTTSDEPKFQAVGGAWVIGLPQPPGDAACTATETVNAGAGSTAWTCTYDFSAENGLLPDGCDAPNGTGTGPVAWSFTADSSIISQDTVVTFTNAFAAVAAVEAAPVLTG